MYESIILKKEEGIATITVNRPEARNALNVKVREELLAAIDELSKDDSIKVVILTGAGDKAFIAGADLTVFKGLNPGRAMEISYTLGGMGLFQKFRQMDKPTIAAINGFCLGGGCELAMCCDIRIASEAASFGQPEINVGLLPGGGGTQVLPRLVGAGRAKELCFTGDIINAREAERIGLVNRVVSADKLMEEALITAKKIAGKSPVILKYIKRCINQSLQSGLDSGLAFEAQSFGTVFGTEDNQEGVNAFLEKRKPQWKGK